MRAVVVDGSDTGTPAGRARIGRGVAVLALVNAVAAWAGAVGLAAGALTLDDGVEERLPFASPVFGAVALAVVVAIPFTVVAVLVWRRDPRAEAATAGAGVLLAGWIIVQLAFLRALSVFHVVYFAMGLLFVWLGRGAVGGHTKHRDPRVPGETPP